MKKTFSYFMVIFMLFTLAACGNETPYADENCWNCGGTIAKQAAFCEHCGVSLKENSNETTSDNGTTGTTQTPTDESSGTGETPSSTCNHSWKNATCTTPKTCETCGLTEGKENGHWWYEATCTDGRICTVCLAEDPNSKPLGHSYNQGKCERCGEADSNYAQPTITVDKTNVYLDVDNQVVYCTMVGDGTITCDIDNVHIVDCEWGEWDGDTIPLIFHPVSSGQTYVTVYPKGYDDNGVIINVSVDKANAYSLNIVGIGEEFETATGLYLNISVINSVDYKILDHIDYNNTISFEVDVVATMIQAGDPPSFGALYTIAIDYELIDENGVYVDTGNLWIDVDYLNRPYAQTIYFPDLEPGNYTLKFSDNFY